MADQNPIDQKTWDERMAAFHKRMEAGIAEQGYSVVGTAVEATLAGGHIPMSYTVGLTAEGLPELVVLSVPHDTAHAIFRAAVAKLRAGAAPVNTPVEGTCNFPVVLIDVQEGVASDNLVIAFQRAKRLRQSPRALQIVVPDAQGRFPWEPGCAEPLRAMQVLKANFEPALEGPRPTWPDPTQNTQKSTDPSAKDNTEHHANKTNTHKKAGP